MMERACFNARVAGRMVAEAEVLRSSLRAADGLGDPKQEFLTFLTETVNRDPP